MLPYFILGLALLVGLGLILRWYTTTDPKTLKSVLKWVGFVVVAVVVVFLAVTGRLGWAIGAATALLPWIVPLLRARRFARNYARMAGIGGEGQSSDVETRFLRMTLDHDTGTLDGVVIEGPFSGRRLGELGLSDLIELARLFRDEDPQSLQILEAYLNRTHPDWQEDVRSEKTGAGTQGGGGSGRGPMTIEEAREILGVGPDASAQEIKAAYHRLIAGLHPDKGGSNYLAAKVNEAKRVLLGR